MSDKTYNYTRQKLPSPRIMSGKQRVCAGLHHVSGPRCGVFQRSDAWPHLSCSLSEVAQDRDGWTRCNANRAYRPMYTDPSYRPMYTDPSYIDLIKVCDMLHIDSQIFLNTMVRSNSGLRTYVQPQCILQPNNVT